MGNDFMDNQMYDFSTIEEYIASYPLQTQIILNNIRQIIKRVAPDAIERISYKMPGYDLYGPLVYFAAYKNHIGLYPTESGVIKFKDEIKEYVNGKGSIRFSLNKPIPYDLIEKIVKFRASENLARRTNIR